MFLLPLELRWPSIAADRGPLTYRRTCASSTLNAEALAFLPMTGTPISNGLANLTLSFSLTRSLWKRKEGSRNGDDVAKLERALKALDATSSSASAPLDAALITSAMEGYIHRPSNSTYKDVPIMVKMHCEKEIPERDHKVRTSSPTRRTPKTVQCYESKSERLFGNWLLDMLGEEERQSRPNTTGPTGPDGPDIGPGNVDPSFGRRSKSPGPSRMTEFYPT
ncbi:hypothetical protein CkaCkLH20_13179 [Colletotrichum karsti]|uniref:Uncharacterized protein n=1 Tax=Colletotrichum karsti TaxID=1095194 RepID=A0A9P6LDW1_9PEZI|nr:uncharacterized protein CkaCkLH20_13179 [Colletotrichum karsti]KAF9869341.1 hypothetical protein CkaCkLH20_13179 [Colletotrichum karsti]